MLINDVLTMATFQELGGTGRRMLGKKVMLFQSMLKGKLDSNRKFLKKSSRGQNNQGDTLLSSNLGVKLNYLSFAHDRDIVNLSQHLFFFKSFNPEAASRIFFLYCFRPI